MNVYRVILSPEALADLNAVEAEIAQAGFPGNGFRFVQRLYEECLALRSAPQRGKRHDGVIRGLRVIGYRGQASICFVVSEELQSVQVLRVLRRWQSVSKAFQEPEEP